MVSRNKVAGKIPGKNVPGKAFSVKGINGTFTEGN